ncbi:MAG: CapA family protein [Synergistaceae bacterium]|nr:CapA family protein [Synergistaceae bacterium]MDD3390572.1 CapA family protein [Synergistaceae bacterium]MDD3689588.1 CapA family protein [Synergistaceae bacterium]MDD4021989.1 CapA family protein [Synergistaceae bacterium]MDD4612840.1 CapA family protein [Synergistaceae bacterium]
MEKSMTFTATGDSLILKHLPDYPEFKEIRDYILSAEARITNLETTLTDGNCFPSAFSGGTWLTSRQSVIEDLKKFGFNIYCWANNHTMDYSYDGLLMTKRNLEAAGVSHCGAGENLYEASKPAMVDLPSGRIGVISICSSFEPAAQAGIQSQSQPGRPGLNPLRFSTTYTVTAKQMKALKEIASDTRINNRSDISKIQGYTLKEPEGTFDFGNSRFTVGKVPGRMTQANKADVERTIETIRDALLSVDYVVVAVHSHEIKGVTNDEPDYFYEEFARNCIDAGACAVVGGGTHQLKGIEMYKQRPIFYSLGNFIFQNAFVEKLPPDYMEKNRLPLDTRTASAFQARSEKASVPLHNDVSNFQTVLPWFRMEGDRLAKLILKPISLGQKLPQYFSTWPRFADETESQAIFETLEKLSAPYGTKLVKKEGVFEVEI